MGCSYGCEKKGHALGMEEEQRIEFNRNPQNLRAMWSGRGSDLRMNWVESECEV